MLAVTVFGCKVVPRIVKLGLHHESVKDEDRVRKRM